MGFVWLVLGIAIPFALAAALLGVESHRRFRKTRGRPSYDRQGFGWLVWACCCGAVALSLSLLVIGVAIDRHYSKVQCDRKNEAVGDRYVWLDYQFFSYDCLLRTPSGNVTETPVLPLEDVTQRSGG